MSIDVKEAARRIILSQVEDTEYMSVLEMTEDEADEAGLTYEQHEEIGRTIHDLIGDATVLAIFPGDEYANAVALLLRDFADMIDRGPDVPLPPSIYSALAREAADTYTAKQVEGEASA